MDAATLPVIVAMGEITDRPADPNDALEPLALMAEAARRCGWRGGWLARTEDDNTIARLPDRDVSPVGLPGAIALDAQNRPEWRLA